MPRGIVVHCQTSLTVCWVCSRTERVVLISDPDAPRDDHPSPFNGSRSNALRQPQPRCRGCSKSTALSNVD
eukprot:1770313-Rhodomonas_salina.1